MSKKEIIEIEWFTLDEELPNNDCWVQIQHVEEDEIILNVIYQDGIFYYVYNSDYYEIIHLTEIKYWSYVIDIEGVK